VSTSRRSTVTVLVVATMLSVGAVGTPSGDRTEDPAGTVARVEAHVAEGLRANRVPGGAMVVIDDRGEVHLRGYGVTGRGGEEVTPDTPFIIGSVTKTMTALAVLQLVEDGSVDLDAPVSRYLDGFSVQPSDRSDEVTVRRLIEHTSGLPALAGAPATTWQRDLSIAETAREVVGAELASTPGTTWAYANANYVLLGALIEEVTGRPYADHLEERLFTPLGMTRSTARIDEARGWASSTGTATSSGCPWPTRPTARGWSPPASWSPRRTTSPATCRLSGRAVNSTASGSCPPPASSAAPPAGDATVGPWAKAPEAAYGLGWFVGGRRSGGTPVAFHPGASPDFGAMVALDPATGSGLALLLNVGPRVAIPGAAGDVDRIGAGAVSLLTGSEPAEGGHGRRGLPARHPRARAGPPARRLVRRPTPTGGPTRPSPGRGGRDRSGGPRRSSCSRCSGSAGARSGCGRRTSPSSPA
jgi:CubicO group peptidase (beta-lactamase class C family)